MAEIKQELGFNAASAIKTLAQLDSALKAYNQGLNKTVGGMKSFNQQAGKTVAALKNLASHSKVAVEQLTKLSSIQSKAVAAPTTGKISTPDISKYIDVLQKLSPLTEKSTTAQKRAWQSLATKTAEVAARNRISVKEMMSINSKLGQSLTGPANTIANNMQKMSKTAQEAAHTWTVSWETMARVVATQMIVRTLSTIREALKSAVSDAVDFQRAVAEIGTIANENVGNLENITNVVTRVSDAFNIGLDDTVEAAYQTLSNQVAQTDAELESFLSSAAKFAKITKTDMTTAVNLLSGTLNAFGKDVTETEDIASKFFKTIELGRVRSEELAQGMGTLAPIADKLGISLEELNASLATLTIGGVKADKAFTQIRGTMQAFLKPTEAMKDALRDLGYASGEQLLQANNLQEALKLIAAQTDGTAAAIARLFPRIRGMTNVLTQIADESGHFNRTMEEQQKLLQETYDRAYDLIITTDAEKITKELRQLKNFFTVEFGQAVLEASVKLSRMIGGADALKNVFKAMAPILAPVALGLGLIATALVLVGARAALANTKLSLMNKALLVFLAAEAAIAAGKFLAGQISSRWDDEFQAQLKVMNKELEARKRKISAEIALEKTKVAELSKILSKGLAKDQKAYFKLVDSIIENNVDVLSDVKSSTNKIIAERQKMVNALQRQVASMGSNIVASEKRSTNLRNNLEDQLFERKIRNESDLQKVNKLTQKSSELSASASLKLSQATTEAQRDTAQQEFARAKAFADQALSIADSSESRQLENKAIGNLKNVTEDLIDAEKRYQQNIMASAKALITRTVKEEKRVEKLKDKQKELMEAFKLTDKEGRLLSQEDRARQLVKAQKALREFIDISGEPLDVAAMLNYTGVAAQLSSQLHDFQIQNLSFSAGALFDANEQLNDAINLRIAKVPELGMLQALSGVEVRDAQSQTEAVTTLETKYTDLFSINEKLINQSAVVYQKQSAITLALKTGAEEASGFGKAWAELSNITGRTFVGETFVTRWADAFNELQLMAQRASKGIIPSYDQFKKANNLLKKTAEELPGPYRALFSTVTTSAANAANALKELLEEQQKLRDLQKEAGLTPGEIVGQLGQFEAVLNFFKEPEESAKAMAIATGTTQLNVANTVDPAAQVAAWQQQMASASERQAIATAATLNSMSSIANLSSLGKTNEMAQGGQVGYFANGGQGTDIINAKLSAGEHVTNAKSSRRFFSQLQAINAGQTPVYRNSGGDTYNTNVGDINITESSRPQQTGREVMNIIRRERRRGSSRI